jgi:hypothetical protein
MSSIVLNRQVGRLLELAVILFASVGTAHAQVHLITGAFSEAWTGRYGSALFEVGGDGKVVKKLDLVPQERGFFWMGMSYELKRAAILVPGNPPSASFLNLDTAELAKQCEFPEFLQIGENQWFADVPGQGTSLEIVHSGKDFLHDPKELYALVADPSIPCGESLKPVPVQQVRYAIPLGSAGVGDFLMSDGMSSVYADSLGSLSRLMVVGQRVALGYTLPRDFRTEGNQNVYIHANNPQILVVGLGYRPHFRLLVFKKLDSTWHAVPELSLSGIRAFGKYVAVTEASTKKLIAAQLEKHPGGVNMDEPGVRDELGPGKSEWTTRDGPMGPSQVASFANSTMVFPGRLHIFDTDTDNVYTITTNQGDSEILLIDNGTVYYRVSDRLYRVPILNKGLGKARLIATDEVVRDAHWAFLTH